MPVGFQKISFFLIYLFQLIKDLKKEPEKIDATMVFTTKEVFQMAEEKFHNMSYFRVPLPSDHAVNENVS